MTEEQHESSHSEGPLKFPRGTTEKPEVPESTSTYGHSNTQRRLLVEACKRKLLDQVEIVLVERPDLVNYIDRAGRSLLHLAAIQLVDAPEANELTSGRPKQQQQQRTTNESIDLVEIIGQISNESLWLRQDVDGLTMLHLAVISGNEPLVRHLLARSGGSRNEKFVNLSRQLDKEGHSALHWAVITGQLDLVALLADGKASVEQPDMNGATPLHYATQAAGREYAKYRRQLRRLLLAGESAHSLDYQQQNQPEVRTEESFDTELNAEPVVDVTNSEKPSSSITVNRRVLKQPEVGLAILERLLEVSSVNLEVRDYEGRTPLIWAATSGNAAALALLISRGAKLEAADSNHLTAVHCAASRGFVQCLEVLLGRESDTSGLVDAPDALHCSPLFYAILSGSVDCVEALLDYGAKKDWRDVRGRSAAHFGALKGQLGALKLLESRKADLWLVNKQGDLPLHYAIRSGRWLLVEWLLERSPYERAYNAINSSGRAPIHLAILANQQHLFERLLALPNINLNQLMRFRHQSEASNQQPTVKQSQYEARQRLQKADTRRENRQKEANKNQFRYESPLDLARRLERRSMIRALEGRGARPSGQLLVGGRGGILNDDNRALTGSKSLFELRDADGTQAATVEPPTPIGFDTAGPTPTGSLSSSSSSRESTGDGGRTTGSRLGQSRSSGRRSGSGISYHNKLMDASIRCRLFDQTSGAANSPNMEDDEDDDVIIPHRGTIERDKDNGRSSRGHTQAHASAVSRVPSEVVTKVNVFTPVAASACGLCSRCSGTSARGSAPTGEGALLPAVGPRRRSPALEEPRFDRSPERVRRVGSRRLYDQHRAHVESPVARYIGHSGSPRRVRTSGRVSQVATPIGLVGPISPNVRRLRREGRIFEELHRLRQSQIRSDRAQEASLVRRLADSFARRQQEAAFQRPQAGLQRRSWRFEGPYEFAAYERFLYDQLQDGSVGRALETTSGFENVAENIEQDRDGLEYREVVKPGSQGESADELAKARAEDEAAERELRQVTGADELKHFSSVELDQPEGTAPTTSTGFESGVGMTSADTWAATVTPTNQDHRNGERPRSPKSSLDSSGESEGKPERPVKMQKMSSRRSVERTSIGSLKRQDTLSSLIMTDALGNLVRRPSLVESQGEEEAQKQLADEQNSNLARQFSTGSEDASKRTERGLSVDATDSKTKTEIDDEMERRNSRSNSSELPPDVNGPPVLGRRKSVVNIGNKLETIFHDVGIEIAEAEERQSDHEDEDYHYNQRPKQISQVNPSEATDDAARSGEEQIDSGGDDEFVSGESKENLQKSDELIDDQESRSDGDAGREIVELESMIEPGQEVGREKTEVENRVEDSNDSNIEEQDRRPDSRKSSRVFEGSLNKTDDISNDHNRMRQSLTTVDHPLKRRGSTPPPQLAGETRTSRSSSISDFAGSKQSISGHGSEATKKVFNGYDLDRIRVSLRESRSPSSTKSKQSSRTGSKSPNFRRHLERSRKPIGGTYKVSIDESTIKERWLPFKRPSDAMSSMGGGKSRQLAKSQPNVGRIDRESSDFDQFTLLYEINQALRWSNHSDRASRNVGLINAKNWCHRRVVRIVDVRALKRTLSLPESLIYSNDLLKKFNILKL